MRKSRQFINPFHAQPLHVFYRMAEETGESDGGEGDGTDDTFDPKAFATTTSATIANLQKELNRGKTTTTKELNEIKQTLANLTKALQPQSDGDDTTDDIEEETETPPKKAGRKTTTTTTDKSTTTDNTEITTVQKQLQALEKQLKAEKQLREAAEARSQAAEDRRRAGDRDRSLLAATNDINAINANDAADFLRSRTVYDEDTDSWGIKDGDDILSMEDGVKKFLPKYMIKPKSEKGGAGGHSTSHGNENGVSKAQLLSIAVTQYKAAKTNPNRAAAYSRARSDYEAAGGDVSDILTAVQE